MSGALRVVAPAKVNLGLRIVGRRDDGYHLLESLFVPLALADVLEFEFGGEPGIRLRVERGAALPAGTPLPNGDENLVTRAVEAFYARTGGSPALSIRLEKTVPIGAGLGGGSSDAGAVLRTLAARAGSEAPDEKALVELAAGLGADVPFFLAPRACQVAGIGEILTPTPGLPRLWLLLANPGESLATAAVFGDFAAHEGARARDEGAALTLESPGSTMRAFEGPSAPKSAAESTRSTHSIPSRPKPEPAIEGPEALARAVEHGLLRNDLEPAALRLCPAIAELEQGLGECGARGVGMSGSGATVYGLFDDQASAQRAQEQLEARSPASVWTCVTHTTDPTHRAADPT